MKAYFTVEAALVFPMVLGIYVLLIYGMFFQYDRCLLEQEVTALAVRGVTNWEESGEEVLDRLNRQAASMDRERYLAFQHDGVNVKIAQGKVTAEGAGRLLLPFAWLKQWLGEEIWTVRAECANRQLFPVRTIRMCRKVLKGEG